MEDKLTGLLTLCSAVDMVLNQLTHESYICNDKVDKDKVAERQKYYGYKRLAVEKMKELIEKEVSEWED